MKSRSERGAEPNYVAQQHNSLIDWRGCTNCDLSKKTKPILGQGNVKQPEVMLIGEAPGQTEEKYGIPFVGKCGEMLREMLQLVGFDDVYITNVVKCRPPSNRTPTEGEIYACRYHLAHEIDVIQPKAIVILGATALKAYRENARITKMAGMIEFNTFKSFHHYRPPFLLYTYHPSYILQGRFPKNEWEMHLRRLRADINIG